MSENTAKHISISTQVAHRGRQLTISSEGYTADEFCDLLDRRFGPPQVTQAAPAAGAGAPSCPIHNRQMKPMQRADKAGKTHMCTAKVGDGWCDQRA